MRVRTRDKNQIKPEKTDRRKIPQLFRAVIKGGDYTYWGYLIDDERNCIPCDCGLSKLLKGDE